MMTEERKKKKSETQFKQFEVNYNIASFLLSF